jgi:hypothetical protein
MNVIWERINDKEKYWMHIAKGLILLNFLMLYGNKKCFEETIDKIHLIKKLMYFNYTDFDGKTIGAESFKF